MTEMHQRDEKIELLEKRVAEAQLALETFMNLENIQKSDQFVQTIKQQVSE